MAKVVKLMEDADLPMEKGGEEKARKFYGRILGLRETMRAPGERGVWFQVGDKQLRLRITDPLPPATPEIKAFLEVSSSESFRKAVTDARFRQWDAHAITGTRGFVASDPFGNRVELREYKPGYEGARERVREEVMDAQDE